MMMKMKTMMTIDLEGKAMGPEDGTPSPFFTSFKPLYFVQKHFKQPRLVYKTKKKKKKRICNNSEPWRSPALLQSSENEALESWF